MERSDDCSLPLPPLDDSLGMESECFFEDVSACHTAGSGCRSKGKISRGERGFFFHVKIGMCFVKAVYLCALFKLYFCHNPRWTELLCKVLLLFLLLRRWNWISKAEIILLIENALYVLDVSFSSFFFFLVFFHLFLKLCSCIGTNTQLLLEQRRVSRQCAV